MLEIFNYAVTGITQLSIFHEIYNICTPLQDAIAESDSEDEAHDTATT